MSRAFVKEQDDIPEELPERPVSAAPNVVTPRGLRLIDEEIEACRKLLAQGQQGQDKPVIARASRDLRYWTLRRSTAQLKLPPAKAETAGFGTRVTIRRDDGRLQSFAIVGEDEADPAQGFIAYTSPLARALMGKAASEVADIPGGEAEIVALEPAPGVIRISVPLLIPLAAATLAALADVGGEELAFLGREPGDERQRRLAALADEAFASCGKAVDGGLARGPRHRAPPQGRWPVPRCPRAWRGGLRGSWGPVP